MAIEHQHISHKTFPITKMKSFTIDDCCIDLQNAFTLYQNDGDPQIFIVCMDCLKSR